MAGPLRLTADRFLMVNGVWVDLATGAPVTLEIHAVGSRRERSAWPDLCAAAARLRHPALRPLLDFGALDRTRVFLAYAAESSDGRRVDRAALRHAQRFARGHGVSALVRPRRWLARGGRPIGVELQPRRALDAVSEAMEETAPAGMAVVDVCGSPGSGLRTLQTLAAREARRRGFVPVDARMLLRLPALRPALRGCHLALFLTAADDLVLRHAVALILDRTADPARRHLLVRLYRGAGPRGDAIMMERMSFAGLTSMIARDRWAGPSDAELAVALQSAAGLPGNLLRALGAGEPGTRAGGAAIAHESRPAYLVEAPRPVAPASTGRMARMLQDAPAHARRLAASGRHAAAIRLLTRAGRVLGARGDAAAAAAAQLSLGWILRSRGRWREARACVAPLTASPRQTQSMAAAIALATLDIDERRLAEAEAALRSAATAAAVIGGAAFAAEARVALARCLLHAGRPDDGLALLAGDLPSPRGAMVHAAVARLHAAAGDTRAALAAANAAGEALEGGQPLEEEAEPHLRCAVWRAVGIARAAAGDAAGAEQAAGRAMDAATAGHLPIQALKCRLVALRAAALRPGFVPGATPQAAVLRRVARAPLPPLLAHQIDAGLAAPAPSPAPAGTALLRSYLDLVQSAADEDAAVRAVCARVVSALGTVDAAILEGNDGRVLSRTGRPIGGEAPGLRAMTTGAPVVGRSTPLQLAVPVVWGGGVLGAIECRFAAGRDIHPPAAIGVLEAAAIALEAPLRIIADRRQAPAGQEGWPELLGTSPPLLSLRQAIVAAARAPFPVLIDGESGSGKELVARALHRLGPRAARRLCTLNCAALSDDLVEAELFGHTRGAFTGAVAERPGLFEEADGGSLFLDEVGELSPRAQAKLLRALQDGEVRRVGESFARKVSARIVAATNRDLGAEVVAGRFRADLRFRLDVIRIAVPPLRHRATDIPGLAAHFWQDATARVGSRATLSPETLAALTRYDWPGNVRELQNVVASLAVHGPRRGRITPALLPAALGRVVATEPRCFDDAREEFERRFVRAALATAGGHKARAARALGVSRQGLAKMLRRLRIDSGDAGGPRPEDEI